MHQGYNSRDDESMGERDFLRGVKKKFFQSLKDRRNESRGENTEMGKRPNDFVNAKAGGKLSEMYGSGGAMKYRKGGANLAMSNSEAVRSGRAGRGAGEQAYGMGGKMDYEKGGMLKALLDDPKQRDMARAILSDTNTKAVTDGKAGRYEMGGEVVEGDEKKTYVKQTSPRSTEDFPSEMYNASMPLLRDMLRGSRLAPKDEQMIAEFVIGTEDIGSVDPRYRDMAQRAKSGGMAYLKSDEGGNFLQEKYFDQATGQEVEEEFLVALKERGEGFYPLSNMSGEGKYVYEIR
tara:strand:- start:2450 stop:3322 length:873 start_codon:yes stop_codon:yes gene_type:complete